MAITRTFSYVRSSSEINSEPIRKTIAQKLWRQGTGKVVPTRFVPELPDSSPLEIFPSTISYDNGVPKWRFVHHLDPTQFLIFHYLSSDTDGYVSGRLRKWGSFGRRAPPSLRRAGVRAATVALRHRDWAEEGFKTVVIATDLEDLVTCGTSTAWECHLQSDVDRGMWQRFLGEVERCSEKGLEVKFWKIPREMNEVASEKAKGLWTREENDILEGVTIERSKRARAPLMRRSTVG
ncbi:hypothetical protein GGR53DRAFT_531289 [Hypoxylon sp. FL1150]|nr:hypothetical protein GGR53DRAFT_531289 [Hypoxylon sp. FL1150]